MSRSSAASCTPSLRSFAKSEAFLFHTRLAHVSSALKERNPARALDRLALMAAGVGGGTKIGECLTAFNRRHAQRVIRSRTCVMILSDGYDTGPPEAIGRGDARSADGAASASSGSIR